MEYTENGQATLLPLPKAKRGLKPEQIKNIIVTVVLSLGSVLMLLPFVWMVFAAFKPHTEIYTTFIPKQWTAKSFREMWDGCKILMEGGIVRGFLNSILTTVPVVIVQVLVSAFAAYAFAKLNFVGKNAVFLILLSTMMIPFAVIMLPQAWLYGRMGLTNGPLAIIIPKLFGAIGTVFFLRQFLFGIPDSISEAARIDGAGYTKTFLSIVFPLLMPALATQAILSFIGNWNDFLGPLLFISDKNWYTLPLLVNSLNGSGGSTREIPRTLAASLVSLVPIIVVFAAFQKKIIGSIVFSAVKG
ncbi:MAG: carbohydrate ABC transporter permease [Clostridia bacterium]|jgi:multiple sugar transport system permease protein|nr:carbohydrate ABC transporter permease [Clostridia bacterium]